MSINIIAYDTQDGSGTINLVDPSTLAVLGSAVDSDNAAFDSPLVLAIDLVNERLWSLNPNLTGGASVFDISNPASPVLLTTGGVLLPQDSLSVTVFAFTLTLAPSVGKAFLEVSNSSTTDGEFATFSLTSLAQTGVVTLGSVGSGTPQWFVAVDSNGSSPRLWITFANVVVIVDCSTGTTLSHFAITGSTLLGSITAYIDQTLRKAFVPFSSDGVHGNIAIFDADTFAAGGTVTGLTGLPDEFREVCEGVYCQNILFTNLTVAGDPANHLMFMSCSVLNSALIIVVVDTAAGALSTTYTSGTANIRTDITSNPTYPSDIVFYDGLLYIYGNAPRGYDQTPPVLGEIATMTDVGTFTYYPALVVGTASYRSPLGPGIAASSGGGPPPTTTTAAPITPEITAASPVNWRTVQFQLASAPQFAKTPYSLGDALNPSSWTLERADGSQTFTAIQVIEVSPTIFNVSFSAVLPSHLIELNAGCTLYFSGSLVTLATTLQGMIWAPVFTPDGVAAQKLQVTTDLANPPTPVPGTSNVGGTLQIAGGDYVNETGDAFVRKMILRLLVTPTGGFFHLPDYGYGILNAKTFIPPAKLLETKQGIEQAIRNSVPEVQAVQAQITLAPNGVLTVNIAARTKPQGSTIYVSASSQPVLPGYGGGNTNA